MLLTTRSGSPSSSRSPMARPRPTRATCRPPPARGRHVAEARAEVEQELVLLTVGLAELRVVVDVREDVAVREEEIELAVEVGVEKRRAPAHAHERGGGQPRRRAGVLELPAVHVAIERVAIVGERREDEVHAQVAVVVAGVGAHAGLRARLAVHRHAGDEPHALEAAVPPGCDTGSWGSSRWPRTDRRSRRRRSRWRRRRSRRRGPGRRARGPRWPR